MDPTTAPLDPKPPETAVEVELLGVSRFLARRERCSLPFSAPISLQDVGQSLATEIPALVGTVLDEHGLLLGGHAFARSGEVLQQPDTRITPGDRLLLFTLSAGG